MQKKIKAKQRPLIHKLENNFIQINLYEENKYYKYEIQNNRLRTQKKKKKNMTWFVGR